MSKFLILIFFNCFGIIPNPTVISNISIEVNAIKTTKGLIRVAVYKGAKNFNKEPDYAFAFSKEQLKNGQLNCQFQLPVGNYAFCILDDLDANNEMDFNLIGIPKEGFGFSNNAKIRFFKAPSFEDCKVKVENATEQLEIKVRYM